MLAGNLAGKLGGKVGVAPRLFLKKLVGDVLDRIEEFPRINPEADQKWRDFLGRPSAVGPPAVKAGEPAVLDDALETESAEGGLVGPSERFFPVDRLGAEATLVSVIEKDLLRARHG
jgi:hypothetical protein